MNVLDLAAFGLLTGAGSFLAVNHASGTLRIPIVKGKDSIFNDWRTVLGIGSLIALPFTGDKGFARHAFGAVAGASVASLAATESMRYATIRRAAAQWGSGGGAAPTVAQLSARPMGAPVAALPAPGASPANPIPVPVQRVSGFGGFGLAA